jgi:hypothetical protein
MRQQHKFEFDMVNTGKHPDVDVRPNIHVSVLAENHQHAIKKAEWQNPCFKVAT